ncbi:MAG: molybdopterin molybdotransferase MoeA, partial [Chloroflexi bacterium]|nr:molybdopterin molybdotransferase MoeA [Chloroflexota bacterium]
PRRNPYDAEMLSVEEARERILSYFSVLPAEECPLVEALGQVLAEDLRPAFDIPPLANSAMDGYAVRAADTSEASEENPVELAVIGKVAAGEMPGERVRPGTAVRIMTGAPVPDGADAVVPFEDTDELDRQKAGLDLEMIGIRAPSRVNGNIRAAGEDARRGTVVLEKGTTLRPGEIGVAASLGLERVSVFRRPVVAIVSTGDELLDPGEPPEPGKIYNSNAYSLAASVVRYGGIPRLIGTARDTVESLNEMLDRALDCDMVLTSAGVSKGDYDVVKDVLAARGRIALWSVRMKPAKPLAFGTLGAPDGRNVPHLGLPGNPVSVLVAFEQFERPAISLMMGKKVRDKPVLRATMDDAIRNTDGRRVFARVTVYGSEENGYRAKLTGGQGSGILTSMAQADGLAICPEDVLAVNAGEIATVQMLDWPDDVFWPMAGVIEQVT